ncbi:MAG TPA: aspartyl protease family protein [Thermoanaerobaculia bacterium]|nr:aspartyl protease family protein [Thermoanaerobaculia bacterium]
MRPTLMRSLLFLLPAGCALYSDVSISPLILTPTQIERGSDLQSMLRKADYLRAIEMTPVIESRPRRTASDLLALGQAELIAGRYDAARRHLRAAWDLEPFRTTSAQIAWALSQLEYLTNNHEASLDWAELAQSHGLSLREWHLDYLRALAPLQVYRIRGADHEEMPLRSTRPDIPRVEVRLNGRREVWAVIDSGAVLSIVSQRLAAELPVSRLGSMKGMFYGLLGEPIPVEFGLLESVHLGEMAVENVPVAIMPDEKMRFVFGGKREFRIDFLLGANFLKEFRLELDFPRDAARFTYLTSADRIPDANQNLFISDFRPMVRGTINRRGWYLFLLDTGSEVTFLNETHIHTLPIHQAAPRVHGATLQGLGGAKKRGARIDDLEIGIDRWAGLFRSVPVYASSESENSAGIIGENFLRNFLVVIDFGKMRLDLIRGGRRPEPSPQSKVTSSSVPHGA